MNAPLRPTNKFREGSTAHRAFRHLELYGKTAGAALARALDLDEDELPGLLGFGLRNGSFARDGDVWMIGDGRPVAAPPPPAPVPPPVINTTLAPPAVLDLPPAAPPPRKAPPAPAPTPPAPAPVSSGIDIDAVHIPRLGSEQLDRVRKPVASVTKPRVLPGAQVANAMAAAPKAEPPAEPGPPPQPELAPISTPTPEPPPAPAADRPRVVAAFCSDGTYSIERGATRIDMDLDEAREVLEHMQFVWRALA